MRLDVRLVRDVGEPLRLGLRRLLCRLLHEARMQLGLHNVGHAGDGLARVPPDLIRDLTEQIRQANAPKRL